MGKWRGSITCMKTAILSMLMMLSTMTLRASDKTSFDLTTLLGETYHNCRIIKVTPGGTHRRL